MIQVTLLRLKFILGLKRFFFQFDKDNSLYNFSKQLNVSSRYDLLFFFDDIENSYQNINEIKTSNPVENVIRTVDVFIKNTLNFMFNTKNVRIESAYNYVFVLNTDKSVNSFLYSNLYALKSLEFKNFSNFGKVINYFYDNFIKIFQYYFKAVQFYIYESVFVLYYFFFNMFFKFRDILFFFKLINKI